MSVTLVPKGPYEVIVDRRQLRELFRASDERIQKWELLGLPILDPQQNGKPRRGRQFKRYDLWKVYRFLEGKTEN